MIEQEPKVEPVAEIVTTENTEEPQEQIVVSIGDQEPEAHEENEPAPVWVKKVRERNRELEKELRETRKQLQATSVQKEPDVGVKPTLESLDYDAEKYETALTSWYDRKRKADEKAEQARAEAEKAEKSWAERLEAYQTAKAEFKADDFDEVEAFTLTVLDQTQQGIIVHGASDPALLIYALGKNEAKAKELGSIKDPVKFAFAIAKLEAQLKVSTRKPATQPESKVSGNSRPSGTIDSTLERLRAEASKTGDFTKVMEYKRAKRKA